LGRVLLLIGVAVLLAGCGTGGLVKRGDPGTGKQIFVNTCGTCHTLAAAGTTGTLGPSLDAAFCQARAEGYKDSAIEDIVAGQIRAPGQYATGKRQDRLQANMPPNLVRGKELADVAAFVAQNAGVPTPGTNPCTQPAPFTSTNGEVIFKTKCGGCHTLAAAGTTGTKGPNLDQLKPPFPIAKRQVINGGAVMPPFKNVLTDQQITAVAKYVAENAGKK
jgi:mono/diheme cytochrome c family protein